MYHNVKILRFNGKIVDWEIVDSNIYVLLLCLNTLFIF